MNTNHVKKIFNKQQAEAFLKKHKPELFGLPTKRSKKEKYLGDKEQFWVDISTINPHTIKEFVRDYSINNTEGKYYKISQNPSYYKDLIERSKISKEESPCHPERFSEDVVKKLMRDYIQKESTQDLTEFITKNMVEPLVNHGKERFNQQAKADYSEWIMLMNCPQIIPTLKHTKGTDMFLLNEDNSIEELDIKTTRSIWNITDPKEAITRLYEEQGADRFSKDPRFYIYLSHNECIEKEKIMEQFNTTYDITFTYKLKPHNGTYEVKGCRLVII